MMNKKLLILTSVLLICNSLFSQEKPRNLALKQNVLVSSKKGGFSGNLAVDGVINDKSRWLSDKLDPEAHWLEIQLDKVYHLGGVHLYSGIGDKDPVNDFKIQFKKDEKWVDIPSANVVDNQQTEVEVLFDANVEVKTNALRFLFTKTPDNVARVKEVMIWPYSPEGTPKIKNATEKVVEASIPKIYLNQSGFNLNKPKRFTAPTLADKTPFKITQKGNEKALYEGMINGNIGDFTDFNPASEEEYEVQAGGEKSVPFRIGLWWLERVTYQNTVNFMIDSRNGAGSYKPLRGMSFGWRDDHHFAFEINTLVAQYLSNPSAYDRMPHQMTTEIVPKKMGALEPCREEAPDIVKLIHWGADVIITQKLDHELMKCQLAYYVYAWPWIKSWMPPKNYEIAKNFLIQNWEKKTVSPNHYAYDESKTRAHDLFQVKDYFGTTKGGLPPGFSVEPNLLMYETLKRDGDKEAMKYFQAAYKQTEWIIANLDWNNPLATKGQRMSEHVTMTGLAHFLRLYPTEAPKGLKAKIEEWTRIMASRSQNMWDFRKHSETTWTPMGNGPTMWNEVGNVVGFPGALTSAMSALQDPSLNQKLERLVYSHFDNCFGRNPCGRHFSYQAPHDIEGVEYGWYSFFIGGNGMLEGARFVLDGAPKDFHYPYHPEVGNKGWSEGWVNFNTAYNQSLAQLAFYETKLELAKTSTGLKIRLKAPINFDYTKIETAKIQLHLASGAVENLEVVETSKNSEWLEGETPKSDVKSVSYGYGFFTRSLSPDGIGNNTGVK